MTDNEIIKYLESIISRYKNATYHVSCIVNINILKEALDTIKEQKAEIKELKDIFEKVPTNAYDLQVEASEKLENQIKSEAIKEFAKRLKGKRIALTSEEPVYDLFKVGAIDNLVKEMTEPSEWNQRKEYESND